MGFTKEENEQMVKELNQKFSLHRKVVRHKTYWAIYIPASDAPILRKHLVYLPKSMEYKMPKDKTKIGRKTLEKPALLSLFCKRQKENNRISQQKEDDIV